MRTLVISDIHANATAFEAVIKKAGKFERTWCLGDIVGYGPDPNDCVDMLRDLPEVTCVMGNHDAGILGIIAISRFNHEARAALEIQSDHLSQQSRDYLELLEVRKEIGDVTFVHGSPSDPIWEYIVDINAASLNFNFFETHICLVGHSHYPSIFIEETTGRPKLLKPEHGDMWNTEKRFILNPGSVGQPRDGNPKASFVIYDDQAQIWQFQRAAYDIASVQSRIIDMGLPTRHATRLLHGL